MRLLTTVAILLAFSLATAGKAKCYVGLKGGRPHLQGMQCFAWVTRQILERAGAAR